MFVLLNLIVHVPFEFESAPIVRAQKLTNFSGIGTSMRGQRNSLGRMCKLCRTVVMNESKLFKISSLSYGFWKVVLQVLLKPIKV